VVAVIHDHLVSRAYAQFAKPGGYGSSIGQWVATGFGPDRAREFAVQIEKYGPRDVPLIIGHATSTRVQEIRATIDSHPFRVAQHSLKLWCRYEYLRVHHLDNSYA
jgi:hypothetical protein